ncbi:MAG: hypothetical protein ACK5HT_18710 [Draconibacterium sp.]
MKNTVYHSTSQAEKSIVVLPFVNMSADSENEYFSDGITEEIINALTRIEGLKVIARTSSFAFKGKNIDVREIATQLGVLSVLEGRVRKIRNRVRITAQLINAKDGTHFWSKNFDRELENIFDLQDEISILIAGQICENFGHFNIQERLVTHPTQNIPMDSKPWLTCLCRRDIGHRQNNTSKRQWISIRFRPTIFIHLHIFNLTKKSLNRHWN